MIRDDSEVNVATTNENKEIRPKDNHNIHTKVVGGIKGKGYEILCQGQRSKSMYLKPCEQPKRTPRKPLLGLGGVLMSNTRTQWVPFEHS